METLLSDWKFITFVGTMLVNAGALWAQAKWLKETVQSHERRLADGEKRFNQHNDRILILEHDHKRNHPA